MTTNAGARLWGPVLGDVSPVEHEATERQARSSVWTQAGPAVLAVLLAFFVYAERPIVGMPTQWADDGLYLRQGEVAAQWLSGHAEKWLGPYDPVVLEKAPLFGFALGLLSILHVPLRLAEFLALVLAAFTFRAAVKPLTPLVGWRLALVVLLLVGLPCLPGELRLLRSAFQLALTSACASAAVGLALRAFASGAAQARWALLCGGLLGLAYLCREESIWLYPVVGGSALFVAAVGVWERRFGRGIAAPLAILFAFAIPVGLVQLLNFRYYGAAVTTLRREPAFVRAHQALTMLEPATRERFVPIRTSTRLKAYAVSPTLARLEGYLEGEKGDPAARNELHLAINGRPLHAREYFVSNFEFVLKLAAYDSGARNARKAERLFRAIADELEAAVRRGEIAAGSRGPALLAAPLPGDHSRIVQAAWRSLSLLFRQQDQWIPWRPTSFGPPSGLQRMSDLTRSEVAPMDPPAGSSPLERPRRRAFLALRTLLGGCYVLGASTALAVVIGMALRPSRPARDVTRAVGALLLLVGLSSYCLAMGVIDTLAYPILYGGTSYNSLGYAPLSVLAAYGLVILSEAFVRARP